jgi:hypothetical protein
MKTNPFIITYVTSQCNTQKINTTTENFKELFMKNKLAEKKEKN